MPSVHASFPSVPWKVASGADAAMSVTNFPDLPPEKTLIASPGSQYTCVSSSTMVFVSAGLSVFATSVRSALEKSNSSYRVQAARVKMAAIPQKNSFFMILSSIG